MDIRDFTGWKYYQKAGVNIGIQSPDGNSSILLTDAEVQYWLAAGNIPDPADVIVETWLDKRLKSIPDGGYGSITEQLELIGEQGIAAFKTHIALVKTNNSKIPKV